MRTFIISALAIMLFGCITSGPPQNNTTNQSGCACTLEYNPVCGADGRTYGNACAAGCANVTVAYSGECRNCTDSDFGRDIFAKGTVKDASGDHQDACINAANVMEVYCANDSVKSESLGCPSTHECKDGACVAKAGVPPTPGATCSDSDGGQEFYAAGSVSAGGVSYNDECTGLQTVKEYYCTGNEPQNIIHQCAPGERCESGKCAVPESACTDTDGGDDIYDKGTLTSGTIVSSTTRIDACTDSDTLREYYCVGTDFASSLRDCPSGYECQNGECREQDCEDSDGTSIYSRGTATKGATSQQDYCTSGTGGIEYRCSGHDIASAPFTCPGGYSCSDGRCVAVGPSATCTDSDGGSNAAVAGTTTDSSGSSPDFCASATSVGEYYCSGTLKQSTTIACPSGQVCTGGECITPCTDSDGGQDTNTVGTTTDYSGSVTDFCSTSVSVGEYYCSGTLTQFISIDCGFGYECSGGKCVPQPNPCTDDDGGDVPTTQGTARSAFTSKTDYCIDASTLKEYYCPGPEGNPTSREYTCTMSACSAGACLP
ncbi:MAG TPA: Kazal-type serine protease inhibitor family protein [Candidatus Bilamarchaeum sp.]|nr:Kazal-type serine protease inhibitor family protein [Candidatus Bilamarchaeum sp.]